MVASTAAGRVVRMVVFVLNVRVALHAVAVVCVDDLATFANHPQWVVLADRNSVGFA